MRGLSLLAVLCVACASFADGEELDAPAEPHVGPARAWGTIPDAASVAEPLEYRDPTPEDPCGGLLDHDVRALCDARMYAAACLGVSCHPVAARVALECLDEAGEGDATFVALTYAPHAATRTYARSVLLRRESLSLDLIREGLLDDELVFAGAACSRWHAVAAEVAVVALLQREDRAATELLLEFVQTPLAKTVVAMSLEGDATAGVDVARTLYARVDDSTWRALTEGLPDERVRRATTEEPRWAGEDVATRQPSMLAAWTERIGCVSFADQIRFLQTLAEGKERKRLLDLEAKARAALEAR